MPRLCEPGYVPSGTTLYVLRLRQLSIILCFAFFFFVFPCGFLTVAVFAYASGHGYFAQMVFFLIFMLVWVPAGVWLLRSDEIWATVPDRVLLAVDDAGVYLADPPRRVPWPQVGGLVAFRTWRDTGGDGGMWFPHLVVVRGGEDCGPSAVQRRLPSPDQWAVLVDLRSEKVRLAKLAAAVHTRAPNLPVWDAGKVKNAGKIE